MSQPVALLGMALLAVLAGASFVMQSTVDASLRVALGSPYWAAFVAQVFALFVLGQMLASLVFDHFALLGLTRRPIDFSRLLGAALVAAGAALVRR